MGKEFFLEKKKKNGCGTYIDADWACSLTNCVIPSTNELNRQ